MTVSIQRAVPRLLLCGGLGLFTTIAVAWALALWQPWGDLDGGTAWLSPRGSTQYSVQVDQVWQPGACVRNIAPYAAEGGAFLILPQVFRSVRVLESVDVDSSWGLARRAMINGEVVSGGEEARGWPCLALYSASEASDELPSRRGGIRVRQDPLGFDHRFIPLLPIWRGLAVDTCLYAAAWYAVCFVPQIARSTLRRGRGRCPQCSYDLQYDLAGGCSECGWNRSTTNQPHIHSDYG